MEDMYSMILSFTFHLPFIIYTKIHICKIYFIGKKRVNKKPYIKFRRTKKNILPIYIFTSLPSK